MLITKISAVGEEAAHKERVLMKTSALGEDT
jgi:hypothetical protein